MTLQAELPLSYFRDASNYSGHWDERAQVWWAKRVIDAGSWKPSRHAGGNIKPNLDPEVVQYGHHVEVEVIVPTVNKMKAALAFQLNAGLPVVNDVFHIEDQAGYRLVRDWLAVLDEWALSKLFKVSWTQGVEAARQWHVELERKASDKAAGERGVVDRVPTSIGWTRCRLGTVPALERKGVAMGHCVGDGGYDSRIRMKAPGGIWSLRDENGRSLATIDVAYLADLRFHYIAQAHGPAVCPLNEKKEDALAEFRKEKDVRSYEEANAAFLNAKGSALLARVGHVMEQVVGRVREQLQPMLVEMNMAAEHGPEFRGENLPAFRQHERRNDRMRGRR